MTTEFLITSLVVILLPGTGVIYTLALGISGGFRAGLLAAFGCTLGIIPHILASVVGLAAVLHASALAFEVLRYVGVAYLLFIAWSLLKASSALDLGPNQPAERAPRIVRKGILTNIFNPKLSLFFLAFLPQFVPAGSATPTTDAIALGLGFSVVGIAVQAAAGLAAGALSQTLRKSDRAVRNVFRTSGLVMMALGARLLISPR